MAKFSDNFPVSAITDKGTIIGDVNANISVAFRMVLPKLYNLGFNEFERLIHNFKNFLELLGGDILVHKQDFYFREYYSYNPSDFPQKVTSDFIERSFQRHFNERAYQSCESYLYITKLNSGSKTTSLVSKDFAQTDEDVFLNNIISASEILKPFIFLEQLTKEELQSVESPINTFCNFSNAKIDELKDIDFSNNRTFVGSKEIKMYTIQDLQQFPTSNVTYCKEMNGLPVANMFDFSYPLDVPHVNNSYIYIPNQETFKASLDQKLQSQKSYNVKGANSASIVDIEIMQKKMNDLQLLGVYYHFNTFCFDEKSDTIEKKINLAFSESGFKKRENSLNRKDLFWAAFPTNGQVLVSEKDRLMSLITDLEACAFMNYEKVDTTGLTGAKGVRLCDRVFGIPFEVDIYDEPKRKGLINNQNTILLSGSGGGKSFSANNIFRSMYDQGDHIFIIDASFSYKLQCAMHGGVYLTFDNNSRISFNPFYMSELLAPEAKKIFEQLTSSKEREEQIINRIESEDEDEVINKEKDSQLFLSRLVEEKVTTLSGLLATISKNKGQAVTKIEEILYRDMAYEYLRHITLTDQVRQAKFDHFYEFIKIRLPLIVAEWGIEQSFNYKEFLAVLSVFTKGKQYDYLLNSEDDKIKNLEQQRFVVIDVSKITGNDVLYSVVSLLSMDLYNQKVSRLPIGIKKVFCVDEAWQSIASPTMAMFMKAQVKVIRKYGGLTFFISQELDDFISSEIIRDSIINNSNVKMFAEMGEFAEKFDEIKRVLAISDNNERKILSINKNRRPGAFYKELAICWSQYCEVYAVEQPLEMKAIFETDADEVSKILPQYEKYGVELTAINYANH